MTKKSVFYALLVIGITAALTVAITLAVSRSRTAPVVTHNPETSFIARATPPVNESQGAQQEGIKVHGHWTIDVRNPDGTLVTHHEFENGLETDNPLAMILGRSLTVGEWQIYLGASDGSPSPCGDNSSCIIVEATSTYFPASSNNVFKTLKLSVPNPVGVVSHALVLSGTLT